jgi:carbon-monoxide dehydrogenase medium subunit
VKPPAFAYAAPESVDEALELMRAQPDDTTLLAGGQSLVPILNIRMAAPALLVDLNGVLELGEVGELGEAGAGRLRLGAMVRQRTLETDPRVADRLPLLAEAATHIAHVPIRTRGTLGGSLAHAEPAAELPAAIAALGARMLVRGSGGERSLGADEFFLGPFTTAIEPGELLAGVEVEPPPPGTGWAFLEIARTHGAFALVGAAALVRVGPDGRIDHASLALCGVGPAPYLASWIEEMTRAEEPSEVLFEHVARRVQEEIEPHEDGHAGADYRRRVAGVLTVRALSRAAERAGSGGPG